jgi:hypothetical protein
MEREVRSMKVKTMKSELESLGVSLLGMAKKDDLIDALLGHGGTPATRWRCHHPPRCRHRSVTLRDSSKMQTSPIWPGMP